MNKKYYMLTFDYTFEYTNDEVYVACTIPYTYSQIQTHIDFLKVLNNEISYNLFKIESAGKSRGNIDIPVIKITGEKKSKKQKPIIVVISRLHPGETHGSFVVHGLINYLLSKDYTANKLRKEFEWWIFPCVNPDGMIIGNHIGTT